MGIAYKEKDSHETSRTSSFDVQLSIMFCPKTLLYPSLWWTTWNCIHGDSCWFMNDQKLLKKAHENVHCFSARQRTWRFTKSPTQLKNKANIVCAEISHYENRVLGLGSVLSGLDEIPVQNETIPSRKDYLTVLIREMKTLGSTRPDIRRRGGGKWQTWEMHALQKYWRRSFCKNCS